MSIELDKIDGPYWNNFGVCPNDAYVGTYKRAYKDDYIVDIYVVNDGAGRQVVLWRDRPYDWEGGYAATPLDVLISTAGTSDRNLYILSALMYEGKLVWEHRK